MCSCQRPYSAIEPGQEIRMGGTPLLRLRDDSAHRGEHIFYAVVELGVQCPLMFQPFLKRRLVPSPLGKQRCENERTARNGQHYHLRGVYTVGVRYAWIAQAPNTKL